MDKEEKKYCQCGCGEEVGPDPKHKERGIPRFRRGHNSKIEPPTKGHKLNGKLCPKCNKIHKTTNKNKKTKYKIDKSKNYFCDCGCGEKIEIKQHHFYIGIPKYIWGHGGRISNIVQFFKLMDNNISLIEKCACGCGEIVKPDCKYISGPHAQRGKKPWNMGLNKKTSKSLNNQSLFMKDLWKKESHRKRIQETHTGRPVSLSTRIKLSKINKGRTQSDETKRKIKENNAKYWTGKQHSEETKNKIRKNAFKLYGNDNYAKKPENRKKISDGVKRAWKDPIKSKRLLENLNLRPNKPERNLFDVLQKLFPNHYKYNDGWFILDGKIPDFVNINGQKKLIELYGDYWHRGDNPQDRIDIFTPYGYNTLIIWEHELEDEDALIDKLFEFNKT